MKNSLKDNGGEKQFLEKIEKDKNQMIDLAEK